MTTDIELAQSLKAAAIDAKELAIIARYSKGRAAAEKFYALANPNNVIALVEALEKAQQRISQLESRTVKLPKPKNSDQGWKIDPEFINKVQDAIGYDDTCECWEGTPSMELVEAVLLAAAGIKVGAE
ncbi:MULTISPECIES: hypothetical protein [Enterobacteriaceae]|uniref:hypothetical protein n=1 Tax=Enterobacteriaceae TaxID=543 RepID=UPI000E2A9972|nr:MULTISPECIES: hypothetical protein [Enterobacteriaceae]MDZ0965611.1 hypothetical protein [Klebsiella pneumoniae]MDE1593032.1 hypothetical protein [Klebsiella quasipneumoniae]MDS6629090.1 hypothetical protein [Klebsiella variicola]SXF40329.1 Uncharacterised protein [Klebsiella variicola]HBT7669626.1 hypothetical protein [Klebsiella pneumoniae]